MQKYKYISSLLTIHIHELLPWKNKFINMGVCQENKHLSQPTGAQTKPCSLMHSQLLEPLSHSCSCVAAYPTLLNFGHHNTQHGNRGPIISKPYTSRLHPQRHITISSRERATISVVDPNLMPQKFITAFLFNKLGRIYLVNHFRFSSRGHETSLWSNKYCLVCDVSYFSPQIAYKVSGSRFDPRILREYLTVEGSNGIFLAGSNVPKFPFDPKQQKSPL